MQVRKSTWHYRTYISWVDDWNEFTRHYTGRLEQERPSLCRYLKVIFSPLIVYGLYALLVVCALAGVSVPFLILGFSNAVRGLLLLIAIVLGAILVVALFCFFAFFFTEFLPEKMRERDSMVSLVEEWFSALKQRICPPVEFIGEEPVQTKPSPARAIPILEFPVVFYSLAGVIVCSFLIVVLGAYPRSSAPIRIGKSNCAVSQSLQNVQILCGVGAEDFEKLGFRPAESVSCTFSPDGNIACAPEKK